MIVFKLEAKNNAKEIPKIGISNPTSTPTILPYKNPPTIPRSSSQLSVTGGEACERVVVDYCSSGHNDLSVVVNRAIIEETVKSLEVLGILNNVDGLLNG